MLQRKSFNLNLARTAGMLSGARRVATMLVTLLLTMTAQTAWATIGGTGTLSDPYTINSRDDWNTFASNITNGIELYAGKYVKLTADISGVTAIAGKDESGHEFKGTFDGGSHTLTFNLRTDGSSNYIAPFRRVDGATIKNLHTAGTITAGGRKYSTGLIGHSYGNVTISNCRSSVDINSDHSGFINKETRHGGFVGVADGGTITISDCLFDGSITDPAATVCGGFIGWHSDDVQVTFNYCLMAGTLNINVDESATFICNGDKTTTLNNCYYKTSYGAVQGIDAGSMEATALATALNNEGGDWQVVDDKVVPVMVPNPNNIKYATVTGLKRIYRYSGDAVAINFTVSNANGTLLKTPDDYTVTLGSNNVTEFPFTVTDKGSYTLTITGNNSYSGLQTKTFEVLDYQKEDLGGYIFEKNDDGEYIIKTKEDLNRLSAYTNAGNDGSGKTFVQIRDIDFEPTDAWDKDDSDENNFTAIGLFSGTYNGQGHMISGIRIHNSNDYQGLFSVCYGTVKNVKINNVRVVAGNYVGGIVGKLGEIGKVGVTITDCYVGNNVYISATSSGSYTGGIVGRLTSSTVSGCVSMATVNGSNFAGGIVGIQSGGQVVKDNFAIGAIVTGGKSNNGNVKTEVEGAIIGRSLEQSACQNNYYSNCRAICSETGVAKTSDIGVEFADRDGAREGFTVTINAASVSLAGSQNTYPTNSITTYSDNKVIKYGSTVYGAKGAIVKLAYSGNVPSGYHVAYTAVDSNGQAVTIGSNGEFTMPGSNVTVMGAEIVLDGKEAVVINGSITNGTIVSNKSNGAINGETVTLTITPDEGYVMTNITVTSNEGNVSIAGPDARFSTDFGGAHYYKVNNLTFTMGTSAATVDATFEKIEELNYVNIPKDGVKSITIPEGLAAFKVYDNSGKNGSYFMNDDGKLLLTAPEGYVMDVSGYVKLYYSTQDIDYLDIYDGSTTSATRLGRFRDNSGNNNSFTQTPVAATSSTNQMILHFVTNESGYVNNGGGVYLTVTVMRPLGVQKQLTDPGITISSIADQTYTGSAIQPVVTVKDGETDITTECDIVITNNTNVGTANVAITAKSTSVGYSGSTSTTFTIVPKTVTITADSESKTYDGTALTKNTFATTALETGDTHTFTVVMTPESTITDVGTMPNIISTVDGVAVRLGVETEVGNYLVITVDGTLTVHPKEVTITAGSESKIYDGTPLTNNTFTATALETGDTHIFTVVMTPESTITDVGTKPNIIATVDGVAVTSGNPAEVGNYLVTTVDGTLTVMECPFSDGNGSEGNPFQIASTTDLNKLATDVNEGNSYEGKYFVLTADITYTGGSSTQSNYQAIGGDFGNYDRYFSGHFDGQGHTISGIRIYKGGNDHIDYYQGLFGQTDGAEVKNIILADARITGCHASGAIVGNNKGTIENCHVLHNVFVHSVQSSVHYHGGIAGSNEGTITGCTSAAALTDADRSLSDVGGIAGSNESTGTISQCIYFGTTLDTYQSCIGAIAGDNFEGGTINNCYYTDTNITGKDEYNKVLTNPNCAIGYKHPNSTVNNCGLAHKVTLGTSITLGGTPTEHGRLTVYGNVFAITYNDGTRTTIYSRSNSVIPLNYTGNTTGYIFNGLNYTAGTISGTINGNATDGYTLIMPAADVTVTAALTTIPWSGSGSSEDDPYIITHPSQLDLLAAQVNSGTDYSGKYFKLGADIEYDYTNLSSTESNYQAIGGYGKSFKGHFDGQNHTVSGIRIYKGGSKNADQYQGLFGQTNGAEVKNIILADARITGYTYVGGIVGYTYSNSTVENCHVLSDVTIHAVNGETTCHGGIVGYNYYNATATGCTSAASITIADGKYCKIFGGIAGCNFGTIQNCLYTGGSVSGNSSVGAIVGNNFSIVTNCYYTDTNITGKDDQGTALDNDYSAVGQNIINNNYTGTETGCGLAPGDNIDNSNFLALLAARTQALTDVERTTPLGTDVSLSYSRTFTANVASTICLPFSMTSIEGGKVYRFVDVEYNNTEGWVATMSDVTPDGNNVSATQANTPYLFMADSNDKVTFSNDKCTVSTATAGSTTNGDWTFHGTYSRLEYGTDLNGNVYGFAATPDDAGVQAGEFVRADDGAAVPSMRCYLTYKDGAAFTGARGVTRGESEEVPETIIVRLIGKNGETDGIGTLTLSTGEFTSEGWYSLDGRKLDGKPTKKGLYIHNGNKVVIK